MFGGFRKVLVVSLFLGLGCLALVEGDCSRKPPLAVTRYPKSPGDNGFKIIVNGDPERYIPGTTYTGEHLEFNDYLLVIIQYLFSD